MDIEIDLERSEYVKKRISLLKSLQIPTLSEAKGTLGVTLAQILFDQCDGALKADFGLTPLKGTGDELWVSPSDLLIGKVALKPPLTSKHIQALTHQGILKIGEEVEKKFWNETRMHEENYFDARKRHLMDQFEELFRIESKNIEQRERIAFHNQSQRMFDEFENILLEELNNLEERLKCEHEKLLRNERELVNLEWEQKFKNEINRTVKKMTSQLVDELDKQKNFLGNNFKMELQKAHIQKGYDINMEKSRCKQSIKQLRHNLECKNIGNMMYLLCLERRKCCQEKVSIEEHYIKEIKNLENMISDRDKQIKILVEERDKQIMEVGLREASLLEIIRHFQKFINFALRAAPTQAEFLLSIEKMMAFELTNTVLKSNYSHLRPCAEILPWKRHEKQLETSKIGGLVIHDYHNCIKELNPPRQEGLSADDNLPAFNYRNKLYVREDFRNMISQGIDISKSSELWSKDVEVLIDTLKKSVSETKPADTHSASEPSSKESEDTPKSTGASSVQFLVNREYTSERQRRISYEESNHQHRKVSDDRRSSLKPVFASLQTINFEQIGTVEKTPALIAATNSLELILKRGSVRHLSRTGSIKHEIPEVEDIVESSEVEELPEKKYDLLKRSRESLVSFKIVKNKISPDGSTFNKDIKGSKKGSPEQSFKDGLVLESKDSIIMKKTSLLKKSTEFNVTPRDSVELQRESRLDIKRKLSKLVTAKNSLEMLRESKIKLFDDPTIPVTCPRKESPKLKSNNSCLKSKCNDKCSQTRDVLDEDDVRYTRKDSAEKSIKMSHIEVIRVDNGSKDTNVAIKVTPIVYETGSDTYSTDLAEIYKEDKVKKNKKKKTTPPKEKTRDYPKVMKIVGDTKATEHLQTTDEFMEQRVHSLIELIKDNPALMRTFTACTR